MSTPFTGDRPRKASLRDDFAAWAHGRPGIDVDVVDTLLSFKDSHLGDGHDARWGEDDLSTLLLDLLPRKVTADEEWIASVVPTMRSYFTFARDTGRLHRHSDSAAHLLAALARVELMFPSAMHDRSKFGMAKSIMSAVGVDSSETDDPEAIQALMSRFNALPEAERRAITDPAVKSMVGRDERPVVPMVRLRPTQELAAAARRSTTLRQAVALAEWVGTGRGVTGTGVLKVAEGKAAAVALGLVEPPPFVFGVEDTGLLAGVRSSREISGLHWLWFLVVETSMVDVGSTVARRSPALSRWSIDSDDDVLALWSSLYAVVLDMVVETSPAPSTLEEAVRDETLVLQAELYTGATGSAARIRSSLAEDAAAAPPGLAVEHVDGLPGRLVDEHLGRYEQLGALERDGDVLTMTPLARWSMRQHMLASGLEAPAIEDDVARLTAAEALQRTRLMHPDERGKALREWADMRDPRDAAEELVAAARSGTALTRIEAFGVLNDHVPADVTAQTLSGVLPDPVVGPHAAAWFAVTTGAVPREATVDVQQWLAVDSLAALVESLPSGMSARHLPEQAWRIVDDGLELAEAWRVEHAQLVETLDAIGAAHPVGRTRKAAKKAAHKARSKG